MLSRLVSAAAFAAVVTVPLATTQAPATSASPQSATGIDWPRVEAETLQHYQALLRFDTSDPPGNERPAAEYLRTVLQREGIPVQTFETEPNRTNVVARLKGNGRKRPILMMAHTDVVTVDPGKWTFPPFSGTRDGGFIYGRGAIDDKDNVVASLMTMLLLKRMNLPLDRDVIFLAEAGEEGSTRVGIVFMVAQHFNDIDAEYCLAEGGGVSLRNSRVEFNSIATTEKSPHAIQLTARGTAGHGSIPLQDNAIVHLSSAIAAAAAWKPPVRLNDTTRAYFQRLADQATGAAAARYRAVLNPGTPAAAAAIDELAATEPGRATMLRSSISPTIVDGGYRVNVIPSEAKATLDVRLAPGDDQASFLEALRKVINDPAVKVEWALRDRRPLTSPAKLDSELFRTLESVSSREYDAPVLPAMLGGATDMAFLRDKGMQCYGVGPAIDVGEGQRGFGAHSDQERILEKELYRFVRFNFGVVSDIARSR
jgi:acetylornithine deacetylase/succinyl-diaminopimelate desuccinylase-like protein